MSKNKKIVVIIPARYESSRFPGKPLVNIGTKPMIEYVYRGCKESKYNPIVIIATDDARIESKCNSFIKDKDEVVMTPAHINTGTERVAWVAEKRDDDIVINVQGDEPLLTGKILDTLIEMTLNCDQRFPVATLAKKCIDKPAEFNNPNVVKVAFSQENNALYFSRAPIPCSRSEKNNDFYRHIGLYGFNKDFLLKFPKLAHGVLEEKESLEQLRVLENGFGIKVALIEEELIGVDTEEALSLVEAELKNIGRLQ